MVDDVVSRVGAGSRATDAAPAIRSEPPAVPRDVQAAVGAGTLGTVHPDESAAVAQVVLRTPLDQVPREAWVRAGAFLDDGGRLPKAGLIAEAGLDRVLRHAVGGLTYAHADAADAARYRAQLGRVRDVVALAGTTASGRTARAASLLDREAGSLSRADVRSLGALLDADVQRSIVLPRTMTGASSFADVVMDARLGGDRWRTDLQRYLDAWRVAREPAEQRAAEAETLMATPIRELDERRLDRLARLLDVDVAGLIAGPRTMSPSTLGATLTTLIDGLPARKSALDRTAAAFARHDPVAGQAELARLRARIHEPVPDRVTSPEAWRAHVTDDAHGTERVLSLLQRAPGTLDDTELALLRDQLGRRRKLWGDDHAGWVSARAAVDDLATTRETVDLYRRVLGAFQESWALARAPVEPRAAEAGSLLSRSPRDLGREDWRRLRLLLAADTTGTIAVPRELDGLLRLERIAGQLSNGWSRSLVDARPYFGAFRAGRLDAAARTAELERILSGPAAGMADDDVDLLRALVTSDTAGTSGLPAALPGRHSLDRVLEYLQRADEASSPRVRGMLQEYLDARVLVTVGREERLAEARGLLGQDAPLSPEQSARLRALLVANGARAEYAPAAAPGTDDAVLRALDGVTFAREETLTARQADLRRELAAYRLRDEPLEVVAARAARALEVSHAERSARQVDELGAIASMPEAAQVIERVPRRARIDLAHALQAHGSVSPQRVAEGLAASRSVLAAALDDVPSSARPLAGRAMQRADDELARMRGELRPGMVSGWFRYPDYAELGGISADLETIAAIARAERSAAAGAEVLAW